MTTFGDTRGALARRIALVRRGPLYRAGRIRLRAELSLLAVPPRDGAFKHFAGIARESSMRPSAHIFVGSKAPWHTITDDLPQHAEFG